MRTAIEAPHGIRNCVISHDQSSFARISVNKICASQQLVFVRVRSVEDFGACGFYTIGYKRVKYF